MNKPFNWIKTFYLQPIGGRDNAPLRGYSCLRNASRLESEKGYHSERSCRARVQPVYDSFQTFMQQHAGNKIAMEMKMNDPFRLFTFSKSGELLQWLGSSQMIFKRIRQSLEASIVSAGGLLNDYSIEPKCLSCNRI